MLLRALAGLLGYIPIPTFVLYAPGMHVGDIHQHLQVAEEDDCQCSGCGDDPDSPEQMWHQMPSEGLWHLLRRSARHGAHYGRNGADPDDAGERAADVVMAEIMLEHAEVTVEEDDA